jgi:hypothetical protein
VLPKHSNNFLRMQVYIRRFTVEEYADIHEGERAFIIGGGPSIRDIHTRGFNWEKLNESITFGVNKAYKLLHPRYLVFGDASFWEEYRLEITPVMCPKFFPKEWLKTHNIDVPKGVPVYTDFTHRSALPQTPFSAISLWGGSGVYALRIAYLMGCNPIYLVGMDIGANEEGKTHFHNDYIQSKFPKVKQLWFDTCYKSFRETILALEERYIKVFSCSKTSRINDVASYVDLDSLL